jgi:ABC-2 type transport system permease protein
MSRSLRLIAGYAERSFLSWMAGRSFLFTLVANQAVTPLIGLAVWSAALPEQPGITGYFLALLTVRLVTVSYEHHTVANRIYEGGLADDLLRPHAVILGWIGDSLAIRTWHLLFAVPLLVVMGILASPSFELQHIAVALPAVILAGTLRFVFTSSLALSALWTERAHGIVGIGETLIFLLGGEAAPVPFVPEAIRPWLIALPFRAVLGFPAEVASGSLSGTQILVGYAWQVTWIAVMVGVLSLMWRQGVCRYVAVGG